MKFKIFLSLMAFATTAAFSQTAAYADGPRFKFQPHYYKLEEPSYPRSSYVPPAVATVRSGSTPSAASMLGPLANLKRTPAPIHAAPAAQPNIMAQLLPAQFSNAFGKPAPQMMPMTASPNTMNPVAQTAQAAPAKTMKISAPRSLSRSQNGTAHLRRPAYPQSRLAHATPIQTYSNGYVPGSTAPSVFAGTSSTSTAVSGVVKYKH